MLVRAVELFIYIAGVVFLSWHYHTIKAALDVYSFLFFIVMFLFGVSKSAVYFGSVVGKAMEKSGRR